MKKRIDKNHDECMKKIRKKPKNVMKKLSMKIMDKGKVIITMNKNVSTVCIDILYRNIKVAIILKTTILS